MLTLPANPRLLGAIAAAGGLAWTVVAGLQIVRADGVRDDVVATTAAHVALSAMAFALVTTVAGLILLARSIPGSRAPLVAGAGQLLLAVASTSSNIRGEDASWFVVAAPVANALWFFGSIAMARALRQAGASRPLAFGLPLVWAGAIPLSLLGFGVFSGAYWITVGLGAVLAIPTRPMVAPAAS